MELLKLIISMGSPWNMIVLALLMASVLSVIGTIAKQIRKYACHRKEIELKRDLVERGLSVDEIERVVAAKGSVISNDTA